MLKKGSSDVFGKVKKFMSSFDVLNGVKNVGNDVILNVWIS